MCLEMVTAVRMSLSTGYGSFKAWALEIALLCGFAGGMQGWGRGDEAAQAAVRFFPLMVCSGGQRVVSDGHWGIPSQKAALL